MDKKIIINKKNTLVLIVIIWLISIGIWFAIANFTKKIETIGDELYYTEIAKSIYLGNGIKVHGINAGFSKILYPVLIAPFFGIIDSSLRITIITLFNCILMTSAIFPIYFIAKKLIIDNKKILIICLLGVFMPSMLFTLTFMSEIVFYPLTLWFVYFWLSTRNRDSYISPILLGIFSYLLYLTKETSLIILLSIVLFEILNPIIEKFILNATITKSTIFNKPKIVKIALTIAPFLVLFLSFKFTIFANIGSIYWSSGIFDNINSIYKFGYFVYAAIYYFVSILFAVLFIPILFPLFSYKKIDKQSRNLFLLLLIIAFAASLIIAFKISNKEDLGEIVPRIHLRYICPILPLFFLVLLCTYEQTKNHFAIKLDKKIIITCLVIFLFSSIYFKGVKMGSVVDQYELFYYFIIQIGLSSNVSNIGLYYFLIFTLNLIICSGISAIIIIFTRVKTKTILPIGLFTSFVLVLFTSSLVLAEKSIRNAYSISKNEINEINEISLENSSNVLFILKRENYKIKSLCSYLNYSNRTNYIFTDVLNLEEKLISCHKDNIFVSSICFDDVLLDANYDHIDRIDYVIFENGAEFKKIKLLNLELIKTTSNNLYEIRKNIFKNHISFAPLYYN